MTTFLSPFLSFCLRYTLAIIITGLSLNAMGCARPIFGYGRTSTSTTPYSTSRSREVCALGVCRDAVTNEVIPTVRTEGFLYCMESFTGESIATEHREREFVLAGITYQHYQIVDACTIRAVFLNGGGGLGMTGIPSINGWMGPGMAANYGTMRYSALYGGPMGPVPTVPATPATTPTTLDGASDAQLHAEVLRRASP